MGLFARKAASTPSGIPTTIANRKANAPSASETGKCDLTMSFTLWLRSTSDGPRSAVKTPFTYSPYCTYQGWSRWNFRSRLRWIEAGTARSVLRNGLPLICRIIRNVNRTTSNSTGIVHSSRLMMNFVTPRPPARSRERRRAAAAPRRCS